MHDVKHLGKSFYVDKYVTGVQSTHLGQYIQRQLQSSHIIANEKAETEEFNNQLENIYYISATVYYSEPYGL